RPRPGVGPRGAPEPDRLPRPPRGGGRETARDTAGTGGLMADAVRTILNDPVTSHMRTDPTRLRVGQSVAEALEYVRKHPPSGRVVYFYVVDDEGRLRGVVPTR